MALRMERLRTLVRMRDFDCMHARVPRRLPQKVCQGANDAVALSAAAKVPQTPVRDVVRPEPAPLEADVTPAPIPQAMPPLLDIEMMTSAGPGQWLERQLLQENLPTAQSVLLPASLSLSAAPAVCANSALRILEQQHNSAALHWQSIIVHSDDHQT